MSNIRISPDQMRGRANEFRRESQSVGDSISNMDRLLGQLQEEWEGEASRSYANRYQSELRPSFQRAQEMIDEIAAALDKTAQEMQDMDARIASGFRG
ncbi:MAG: WXG100 family type VII secretion target [Eggerthellaceae bacterium]|nr:WXG100 family type VII secretion target [Eggerthellaceae bacterium]